jgi:hypothetical protein
MSVGPAQDQRALQAQGERVIELLEEANVLHRETLTLRREALALQKQALEAQREIVEQTRGNIERARHVNEQALALQKRARNAMSLVLPLIVLLVGYVTYLLFFRLR